MKYIYAIIILSYFIYIVIPEEAFAQQNNKSIKILTAPFQGIFCMNEGDGQRKSTLRRRSLQKMCSMRRELSIYLFKGTSKNSRLIDILP